MLPNEASNFARVFTDSSAEEISPPTTDFKVLMLSFTKLTRYY